MDFLKESASYLATWLPDLYPDEEITTDYVISCLLNRPKTVSFCLLMVLIRIYLGQKWTYWKARGIDGPPPSLMKFGNMVEYFEIAENRADYLTEKYGDMFGFYTLRKPMLYLNDLSKITFFITSSSFLL